MQYKYPKLKEVSKAKHQILEKYFPAWARILGSKNPDLVYVDCFAGSGQYAEGEEGSPLLIFEKAIELARGKGSFRSRMYLIFVEKDLKSAKALKSRILRYRTDGLVKGMVFHEDAHEFVPKLLNVIPDGVPAFFFIDPYGHPLTIPVMNKILQRNKTEILLTLMWYAINMHLNNPKIIATIDKMFGHDEWRMEFFVGQTGYEREKGFMKYFLDHLEAQYKLKFRIRFSPEDRVPGGVYRTKYYLIHLANHVKAALLMKEVMWRIGDELGTFDYSATAQQVLFSQTPSVEELIMQLKREFAGERLTFEMLKERTWDWPFIEKQYREAVKALEKEGVVRVIRRSSKKSGIGGKDEIVFLGRS